MDWKPEGDPEEAGRLLADEEQRAHPDQLHDVPPMITDELRRQPRGTSEGPRDERACRCRSSRPRRRSAPAEPASAPKLLAQPRGAGPRRGRARRRQRVRAAATFELDEERLAPRLHSVLSVSTALAAVGAACAKPHEKIVPFVRRPGGGGAGQPAALRDRVSRSTGTRAACWSTSHEGRPTKVEGNPAHPQTLGATTRSSRRWSSASTTTIAPSSCARRARRRLADVPGARWRCARATWPRAAARACAS